MSSRFKARSGTVIDRTTYAYDRAGNVTGKATPLNPSTSATYAYDALHRLASDTKNAAADQAWALDALGNSTSVTTAGTTTARTHTKENRLTKAGDVKYVHDPDGNRTVEALSADFNHDDKVDFNDYLVIQQNFGQTARAWEDGDADGNGTVDNNDFLVLQQEFGQTSPAAKYTYDAWDRMTGLTAGVNGTATTTAYAYDALNRRIKAGGTTTYFDAAWQAVEDRTGSRTTAEYVWSPVYIDAMIERDADDDAGHDLEQRLYPTQDANWDVTSVTDTNGVPQARYDYTAYGQRTVLDPNTFAPTSDTLGWRQGFQGGTAEATLPNLTLFRNRVYDARTMRWVQEDSLMGEYQDGNNLYQTEQSNPIDYLDFLGLSCDKDKDKNEDEDKNGCKAAKEKIQKMLDKLKEKENLFQPKTDAAGDFKRVDYANKNGPRIDGTKDGHRHWIENQRRGIARLLQHLSKRCNADEYDADFMNDSKSVLRSFEKHGGTPLDEILSEISSMDGPWYWTPAMSTTPEQYRNINYAGKWIGLGGAFIGTAGVAGVWFGVGGAVTTAGTAGYIGPTSATTAAAAGVVVGVTSNNGK